MEPAHLVSIRFRLKLTQARLAEMMGVSRATVSMWENGHAPIHKAAVQLLTMLFPWLTRREEQQEGGTIVQVSELFAPEDRDRACCRS